ncbi:MAG: cell division FtsA domain-containing protein, partial [Chloroflexota bacterium]|nr:cell division FtsA domain-containing protein [Chloroflexota bacterium]
GTTDVAIFKDGCVWHSAILPVGGYQLTRDIAIGLGMPNELAEEMKKKHGNLMTTNGSSSEISELDVGNRHTVSTRDLNDVIRLRLEEILRLIMMEVPHGEHETLVPSGLVLAGGTANIPGIDHLGRELLDMSHVRVGVPGGISGISDSLHDPGAATGVGLLFWGANNFEGDDKWRANDLNPGMSTRIGNTIRKSIQNTKRFIERHR